MCLCKARVAEVLSLVSVEGSFCSMTSPYRSEGGHQRTFRGDNDVDGSQTVRTLEYE